MALPPQVLRWCPAFLVAGLLLLAGCGEGSKESSSKSDKSAVSPSASVSVPAEVLAAFKAADARQAAAFVSAEAAITKGRDEKDLAAAQVGGRAARDALFALDADLREISFPADVQPKVTPLLTSIGEAISALDKQNTAADQAAYLDADARTGPAVEAVRARLDELRTTLGLPAGRPEVPSPSDQPEFVSAQKRLDRGYVRGAKVSDAKAWRDDLLEVGRRNVDAAATYETTRSYSFGIVEAWAAAFPFLEETGVVGSAVEAPPSGASGFTSLTIDSDRSTSATNPEALPFAVRDASGRCAAGVLYGVKVPDKAKALTLPAGAMCTGNDARKAAIAAGFN